MKSLKLMAAVFVMVGGMSLVAHAEGTPAQAEMPKEQAGQMANHQMMDGKMDKEKMHSMMKECMSSNKDGKMCESQTMEQCEKGMDKKECKKMMKKSMHSKK